MLSKRFFSRRARAFRYFLFSVSLSLILFFSIGMSNTDAITAARDARVESEIAVAAASGAKELDLSGRGLTFLPPSIGTLLHLEKLNLADNALSSLPDTLAACTALRILFFLNNRFTEIPAVVGLLPRLEMLSFKSNVLTQLSESALPPTLRWLILTDNKLRVLPAALGQLRHLRKLMLATNQIEVLPDVSGLVNLELVRLSDNRLRVIPPSLLSLPKLAWLALAGNELTPLRRGDVMAALQARSDVRLDFDRLELGRKLGEGASGTVFEGVLSVLPETMMTTTTTTTTTTSSNTCGQGGAVAIKVFKAASSDGRPLDEVAALLSAPHHASLINAVGFILDTDGGIKGSGDMRLASVLEFCSGLAVLGKPPSFSTVTRDVFSTNPSPLLTFSHAAVAAHAAASALAALHSVGIAHGDVYAHNLMVDAAVVAGERLPDPAPHSHTPLRVKLGDLGAAYFYDHTGIDAHAYERIDMRGFACLVDDMVTLALKSDDAGNRFHGILRDIARVCGAEGGEPSQRPIFKDVEKQLFEALAL
jgi:hypothetical protein